MTNLTLTTFLSLDGVMQGPGSPDEDPSDGFDLGGWLVPFADGDMGRIISDCFGEADSFLFGRRTYEIMSAQWPRVGCDSGQVASRLAGLDKYVVSTTLDRLTWKHATLIRGNLTEEVARLKRRPGRELQIHGSGALARSLMAHDLIDEYRLWFYPVVLGRGKRLFADGAGPSALRLVDTKTTSAGVAVHTYRPAGRLALGECGLA
ncbi:MAG TPA: dihydrofolate reductase family protein [Nocardioidaceae bacterium]|nr:dihydrofolate reductase family protein [Nocardioidaceae bacterium]